MSPIFFPQFLTFFSSEVMTSAQNAMRRKLCDSWVMTNNMYQVSNIGDIALENSTVSCDLQGKMGILFFHLLRSITEDLWRRTLWKQPQEGQADKAYLDFYYQKKCRTVATLEETTLHAANPTENQYSSLRWWIWFLTLKPSLLAQANKEWLGWRIGVADRGSPTKSDGKERTKIQDGWSNPPWHKVISVHISTSTAWRRYRAPEILLGSTSYMKVSFERELWRFFFPDWGGKVGFEGQKLLQTACNWWQDNFILHFFLGIWWRSGFSMTFR